MADLFCIGWTTVEPALVGLPDDGVEGLLHAEIHNGVGESKDKGFNESIEYTFLLESFEHNWSIVHAEKESFKVALN